MEKKCILCGSSSFGLIHTGTRDNEKINVLKCDGCGLVTLSEFPQDTDQMYKDGGMHVNAYDAKADKFHTVDYDRWVENTAQDDDRRYEMLADICRDKNVLEFGCGNGGFLRRIKKVAKSVVGVELETDAVRRINADGIKAVHSISEILDEEPSKKYDVIVSFMVIEHLTDPFRYLEMLKNILTDEGVLVCTTVNADDALISYYDCKAFQDFTYWSEHVYLYNESTLAELFKKAGFDYVECRQVQRYPLANHLYWLSVEKPGGGIHYAQLNDGRLNEEYTRVLRELKKCDSLCLYAKKW